MKGSWMELRYSPALILATTVAFSFGCGGEGTSDRNAAPAAPGPMSAANAATWEPPEVVEAGSPVGRLGQLRVEGTSLVDQAGNPAQLKGVSTMWLNWERNYSGSKEALRWMRDNWGLSVIRAAMGVEPVGAFLSNPSSMIAQVRTVVRNAIDVGVYVIIDWHDHEGEAHQAEASEFFAQMSAEFGEFPNVLYETYNEPVRVAWSSVVKPYHEAVSAVIREQDPDNIIIMGTPFWSQAVDEAAADPVAGTNLMYTVHFYSCEHGPVQRARAQNAFDAGLSIFVTEWGATAANGGTDASGPTCEDEAQLWHDFMDERGISWTAWKLDGCADLSCLLRAQAPRNGGWTAEWLNGHAPFVLDRMQ
jgi:endoglucanase